MNTASQVIAVIPSAMVRGLGKGDNPMARDLQGEGSDAPADQKSAQDVSGVMHAKVDAAESNQHGPREESPCPWSTQQAAKEHGNAHVVGRMRRHEAEPAPAIELPGAFLDQMNVVHQGRFMGRPKSGHRGFEHAG